MNRGIARMKITQVMLSAGWGGAERLFLELCTGLAESGHQVQTVCRSSFTRNASLSGTPGITLVTVPARGNWDLLSAVQVERAIRSFSPQVIHAHLSRATWMSGRAGRKLGIPVITTTHNRIKPKYFRDVGYFTTITEDLRRYLVGCGVREERIRKIPNFSLFTPVDSPPVNTGTPPVFVSFGRFVPKKGYRHLLEAFSMYSGEKDGSKLLIGGGGPLEPSLREMVADLGLEDRVEFRGWVEDVPRFLAMGDIFVLPSLDEPFGIVVLEAMARGTPIVSTATSGPAEILDDSTCYFARPGDSADLCRAMTAAARDGSGRIEKARRALDLYRSRYTLDRILPEYVHFYSSVTAGLQVEHPPSPGPTP